MCPDTGHWFKRGWTPHRARRRGWKSGRGGRMIQIGNEEGRTMQHRRTLLIPVACVATIAALVAVSDARAEASESTAGPLGQTESAALIAYYTKPICKREQVTGSHIPKRVCRTQAQVDADRANAQQLMRDANSQLGRETAPPSLGANPMRP